MAPASTQTNDFFISVVIATYNRANLLKHLLEDLNKQTLQQEKFEVIVVDDGSKIAAMSLLGNFQPSYSLKTYRLENSGAAHARHYGILQAKSKVIVILDDDMRIPQHFLEAHWQKHQEGADVVLGCIRSAEQIKNMPLFERFHASQLENFVKKVHDKKIAIRGVHLCTGNVSFERQLYLKIGGFDLFLKRSEDRELGIRFEKQQAVFAFCEEAYSVHRSDHQDLNIWLKRAFYYGVFDHRIAQKHPDLEMADPFRFWYLVHPLSRLIFVVSLLQPQLAQRLAKYVMQFAQKTDGYGFYKLAIAMTTLCYGVLYFSGVREDIGGIAQTFKEFKRYHEKRYPMKESKR